MTQDRRLTEEGVAGEVARDLERRLLEASVDPLTGLLGRRSAERGLARLGPGDSVVVLDVDGVGRVNDEHGRAVGDEVLRGLAALLRQHADAATLLARTGADEFVVQLPGTAPAGAAGFVARLRAAVDAAAWPCDPPRLSAGIAGVGEEGGHAALHAADAALHAVKRDGGGATAQALPEDGR